MIDERDLLARVAGLRRETLHVWIERGWVAPEQGRGGYRFREIDVARVRLIEEFHTDLELGDDALEVILPLLDQVHGLRRELRRLAGAVEAQPEDVRRRIARSLAGTDGEGD